MRPHQDCSEDSGADAVCHLELSFVIGSREVVVPPRTKHPENQCKNSCFCKIDHLSCELD